ncbi:MAG: A/G-specific adenine glycosylase [Bacteroidales bacterium]
MKWINFIFNFELKIVGAKIMKISNIITEWYKKNRRNLPWRETSDPYLIWVSEVILQQTRVNQGLDYYLRFTERFPDIHSLAAADEQELMKMWQGLGYYSRARNLLVAARQVTEQFNGIFPSDQESLLQLKGVGKYTAAAVASIAFNKPVAAVDGNVARVLSRLFAVSEPVNSTRGEKMIDELAGEILDSKRPGDHNQALMEFGALQCIPYSSSGPLCEECPLKHECMARNSNNVAKYPVKLKSGRIRNRYFTYLIINNRGQTFLKRRTANDIWKQMFEFPLIEHNGVVNEIELLRKIEQILQLSGDEMVITSVSEMIRHQLTHQYITAQFVHLDVPKSGFIPQHNWLPVLFEEVNQFPLPRLIDRYLEVHAGTKR